jgi:methionyl-tRNA formyltransferase
MGSDAIALPALDWITREGRAAAEIVGVFTQPDRPSGRGQKLTANAIKLWAAARGLPVFQPEKLGPSSLADLRALAPDAVLVMAYGHILRQEWLDAPPCGTWNLHASLLPKLRGASPIAGAILSGEQETGVTLMRMVLALDAGPVLGIERVTIDPQETSATLEPKIAAACVPLLARGLGALFDPAPRLEPQDAARATFTRRFRKDDGRLDFAAPAAVLARRINALFPWPGAFFELGGEVIKIGLAELAPALALATTTTRPSPDAHAATVAPGTVLAGAAADALTVATGEGAVRLLRLQRPGGRMLSAADFLRGHPIAAGTVIASAPMSELVSTRPIK